VAPGVGRDERADGAVVGERGEQEGRRARVLLRVGEEGRLADFLLVQRNYKEVVRVIRQGVRWLQGREKETGWVFELHEPEPSESQPTPQANVKLIRRLVLKERFARG
jgi:hypothetical protein